MVSTWEPISAILIDEAPTPPLVKVLIGTIFPLWMGWTETAPIVRPRYKILRGVRVQCGWRYLFRNVQFVQENPGHPGGYHNFNYPLSDTSRPLWVFFSTHRNYARNSSKWGPFYLPWSDLVSADTYVVLEQRAPAVHSGGSDYSPLWDAVPERVNWFQRFSDLLFLPRVPQTGLYQVSLTFNMSSLPPTTVRAGIVSIPFVNRWGDTAEAFGEGVPFSCSFSETVALQQGQGVAAVLRTRLDAWPITFGVEDYVPARMTIALIPSS